jgi:hypothetical protein
MTLCLVKHADGDVRLHDESGAELFDAPDTIQDSDNAERELVEAFVDANTTADLLGDDVRPHFVDLVSGNWIYRDLTISDETVPWQ